MKRYGLIGRSLTHSYSQKYFREKFARLKIVDCDYELFELRSIEELKNLITLNPELCGFNVTIPYKQVVISYLDEISSEANESGAVNTVLIDHTKKLIGYNTDVIGFEKCLRPVLQGHLQRALVLGTGGASAAVVSVLKKFDIKYHLVSSSGKSNAIGYKDLNDAIISSYFLIINTTPVGQFPFVGEYPQIPYDAIGPKHVCLDLIYNPTETEFLRKCHARGAQTDNGLSMLYAQAEASWLIWNGDKPV